MKLKIMLMEAVRLVTEEETPSEKFSKYLKTQGKLPHEWDNDDLVDFYKGLGYELTDKNITTWIYGRTNAYDLVARIRNGIANVIVDADDFPKLSMDPYYDEENAEVINDFMENIIKDSDPDRWETYYAEDIISGCDILWEGEILNG